MTGCLACASDALDVLEARSEARVALSDDLLQWWRRAFDRPDKYAPISLSRNLPGLLNWRCASRYFT